ncbi:MAG: lipid-A-disaccharide synthase [Acidobacteria bacterium]|nr:lipid-A-disaccharide synthase [Acidobacteriota bacterium]
MIVVGEVSGDIHAAKLVKALREISPQTTFEFFGATSDKLREAGVETIINANNLSIVGLPEIARALPMFWQAFQTLKKVAIERKPDAVILVDFPDFNLKLAKALKKNGLKIIYYISPQLWAWRKYRKKTIEKYVDLLLTILPFEKNWYQKEGIAHVEYVGNPLAGEVKSQVSKEDFCAKHNLDSSKPIVALLPGSRHKEIIRILPVLLETASLMAEKNADLQFVIALPSTRKIYEVETAIAEAKRKNLKLPENLLTVQNETREVLNASDIAAITSGTATLEAAIIGTPMAIVYKTSVFNYKLLRPLITVEHFGLINLIAQQRLAQELIQDDCTPKNLSTELFRLLEKEKNQNVRGKLSETVKTLGPGGASKRAAQIVLKFLQSIEGDTP